MRRILRPLVALAAGLALLVLTATPSAATAGTIVAGTASINLTPALPVDLEACSSTSVVITTDTTTSATGTWGFTFVAPYSTSTTGHWVLQATISSTTPLVTIDKTTDTFTVASFMLTGTIRPTAASGSCVPTGTTPTCPTVIVNFSSGLTGPWAGTVSLPDLTGGAALDGAGTISVFGCTAPHTMFNGKVATIDDMVSFY
ncbi:MAG TPA: hypothetical protein VF228_02100 [Iamia sp.]